MQTIEGLISKKFSKKNKKIESKIGVKYQFQEISCELADEFHLNGKEKGVLFGFIKNKLEKGYWWKIKEVREYMDSKGIKSLKYFMACFNKENERKQREKNSRRYS